MNHENISVKAVAETQLYRAHPWYGLIILTLIFFGSGIIAQYFPRPDSIGYRIFVGQAILLLLILACYPRAGSSRPTWGRFINSAPRTFNWISVLVIIGLYLAMEVYRRYASLPIEPFMSEAIATRDVLIWCALVVTTLFIAPITEEVLFRGLAFAVFRRRDNWLATAIAIILPAMFFAAVHVQYRSSTKVFIFILGVYFGIARHVSKGLLLPIFLHVTASLAAWLIAIACLL